MIQGPSIHGAQYAVKKSFGGTDQRCLMRHYSQAGNRIDGAISVIERFLRKERPISQRDGSAQASLNGREVDRREAADFLDDEPPVYGGKMGSNPGWSLQSCRLPVLKPIVGRPDPSWWLRSDGNDE
jgi:hypothetical protein